MLFVARGFRIALLADDGFSKLLAAGLTFGFALQTFIIVGGVLRVIPLTGITLPFVSYGGSSVVANFILLALLLLVSNRANAQRGARVNRQITRLARRRRRPDRRARRRDDVLAGVGRRRSRRPAGQRRSSASRSSRSSAARSRRSGLHAARATGARRSAGGRSTSASTRSAGSPPTCIGYSTQSRFRTGLERSMNDYLTGAEREPLDRARHARSTGSRARRSRETTSC